MAGAAVVLLIIYLVVLLGALALGVASYILGSLGLSTVAERRGIRNSWLAWIPLANLWIWGSISDQYQYLVKGKIKNRRKSMLVLSIVEVVLYVMTFFGAIISALLEGAPSPLFFITYTGLIVGAVILAVWQCMCWFDFFRSCEKSNATLYLILSIIFPVVKPFLVFACRKKDEGMPPRKQPAPPQTPAQPAVPAEPVQVEATAEEIPPVEEIPAEEPPVEEIPVKPEETVQE
jgi:hypothetical protein